jgi:hypothetical protein
VGSGNVFSACVSKGGRVDAAQQMLSFAENHGGDGDVHFVAASRSFHAAR